MIGSAESLPVLLRRIHHLLESAEGRRITQEEMSKRLGISMRTYVEYLRGTNAPIGMRAILDMLAMLDQDDVIQIMDEWKSTLKKVDDGRSQAESQD